MPGFSDPILDGGGNLTTRAQEQSPNFVHGVSGWKIAQDGSAEFNNVVIRGSTTTQGVTLFYNGTPAAGNLIASIAPAAGTDSFGNAYVRGEAVYLAGGSQYVQLDSGATINFQPENDGLHTVGSITPLKGIGAFDLPQLVLTSPCATSFGTVAKLVLGGAGTDNNQAYARLTVQNGATIDTYWTKSGETWQAPILGSGWASGPQAGTFQAVGYRRDIEDNIVIRGAVHTTSATPATTIFNLASSWRPGSNWRGPGAVCNNGGTATVCYLEVDSNGNVSISPNEAASGNDVYFMASVPAGVIS